MEVDDGLEPLSPLTPLPPSPAQPSTVDGQAENYRVTPEGHFWPHGVSLEDIRADSGIGAGNSESASTIPNNALAGGSVSVATTPNQTSAASAPAGQKNKSRKETPGSQFLLPFHSFDLLLLKIGGILLPWWILSTT